MVGVPAGKTFAGGRTLLRRTRTRIAAAVAAGGLILAGAGVGYADDIYNTLDGSVDSVAKIMPLNVGGPNGTTTLAVQPTNEEGGKPGCNLGGKGSPSLTLNLISSHPSVATVSPSTATFTSCGSVETITVTPVAAGSASITASIASNTSGGLFNLDPAAFSVNVAPAAPSNTAPVLGISEVANGASYTKGTVPAAACNVTDTEDGPSTFLATLSAISGPDGATGIGSQEATCSYTDAGGLTVVSSVTYGITDGTAPQITHTLTPATPDGSNGWYKSAVTLDWTVAEADSPSTLVLSGCEDQTVTLDQLPATYACSATSGGGSAGPETVSIQKDGTAPTVGYADATGTLGNNGWYTSDVSARFTATDATSGLLTSTQSVPSSGEGAAVEVQSPAFTDIAGNTRDAGAAVQAFNIDKAAPTVSYTSALGTEGTNGWYRSDVEATFSATDLVSGPLLATKTAMASGEGTAVQASSPEFEDVAGNIRLAGAATATFKIDKTAPAVALDEVLVDSYYGSTPAAPACTASDSLSGLAEDCVVTGYSTAVGEHELTATAIDRAGNRAVATQKYRVKAWNVTGFYQPVDMNNVLNTVKGGSTVPAKFEVFAAAEITDPGQISFSAAKIVCSATASTDEIETTVLGTTSLKYDATAGQFVYNWKTPTGVGTCYKLTMTAKDGTAISANFKLK